MPNKQVYSISIFGFFSPPYLFIWPYMFSFSTLLDKQIFHSNHLFGPLVLLFIEIIQSIHPTRLFGPTRLIGTWENPLMDVPLPKWEKQIWLGQPKNLYCLSLFFIIPLVSVHPFLGSCMSDYQRKILLIRDNTIRSGWNSCYHCVDR